MFSELTRDDVFRIETRRLWLRWPRESDVAAIESIVSLHAVAKMTTRIPHPYPEGEAQRFVGAIRAGNAAGSSLHLAMTEKQGARQIVGMISIKPGSPNRASLGFLVAPAHWGKGYASEAVRAMIVMTFQLSSVQAIESCVFVANPASARVHEKCGFMALGRCQMDLPLRGGLVDVERFSLSRRLWQGEAREHEHFVPEACEP